MFSHYQMTLLEEFVEATYEAIGITSPEQITVEQLSSRLNIWVHYGPVTSRALEAAGGMYSMFLDDRLSPTQQRLDFLHELCHLLRHAGNQMSMPAAYTRMQELEAEQFVLYAAMPSSMVSRFTPILPTMEAAVPCLADTFNVPIELAAKRVDQIKRRIVEGYRRSKPMKPNHGPVWSRETSRILEQLDRQLIKKGLPPHMDKGLI